MRAPFALAADGLGGGTLAVFRAVAVPCLLAGAALGVVLAAGLLARGAGRGTVAIVVGLCAANPITLRALEIGHPEELLGAALCAGAVLAACAGARRSPASCSGSPSPTRRGRCSRSARCCSPCRRPPARAPDRGRHRHRLRAAAAAHRAASGPPAARRADRRDLPAMAGVVVLRRDGRRDPRRRRARQGGLPLGSRLGLADQPPADRRSSRCRCRCSPGAGAPTRCCCWRCCSCCAASWTRGTPPTTRCPRSSRSSCGRRRAPSARRSSRSALTMATWATWQWVVPAASADVEALVYLGWSLAARRAAGLAALRAGAAGGARRSARAAGRASGARRSSAR